MLVSPLIAREFTRECRSGRHFLARMLFTLGLAGFVGYKVLAHNAMTAAVTRFRARMASPGVLMGAMLGQELFNIWAVAQCLAMVAYATVRAAALADERRTGSLPLLRSTAMRDGGIVLGWFLSVMGRAFYAMLLVLPILAISRGLGGFTTEQAAAVMAVTIGATAAACALALAITSRSANIGSAAIAASVVICVVELAATATLVWAGRFLGGPLPNAFLWTSVPVLLRRIAESKAGFGLPAPAFVVSLRLLRLFAAIGVRRLMRVTGCSLSSVFCLLTPGS